MIIVVKKRYVLDVSRIVGGQVDPQSGELGIFMDNNSFFSVLSEDAQAVLKEIKRADIMSRRTSCRSLSATSTSDNEEHGD